MNELFQNFDIVISDNNMDIRNFLVLFASGHGRSKGGGAGGPGPPQNPSGPPQNKSKTH
jgi:hypothetical protein